MWLNRWNQWLIVIGLLGGWTAESRGQHEPKPLSELDRLTNWYPVYRTNAPGFQADFTAQPHAYANFEDLLKKVSEGQKVEALTIDANTWKQGRAVRLAELKMVRVLNLNGLTTTQIDSLVQLIQGWSALERLVVFADQTIKDRVGSTRQVMLPARLQQLQGLRQVRLTGNNLDWKGSIQTLATLKNLRQLELDNWWHSASAQQVQLGELRLLNSLKISGQSWVITAESFAGLSQLSELTLANVKIDSTTFQAALNGLPQLEELTLQTIRSLRTLSLGQLKSLKGVELMGNAELVIDPNTFAGLSKLEHLAIHRVQRLDLSGICSLAQVRTLNLSGIGMPAQLPACIGQLSQLTELRIENIKLGHLPESIGLLRQLKKLTIGFCELDSLPSAITRLSTLEALYLEGNKLTQLPDIGKLRALRQFVVSSNKLTALPDEIGQLTRLTALNASGNQLRQLPSSIGRLTSLRTLALQGNRLERLPDGLGKLRKVQFLGLNNNQLTELPASIGQLDSLQKLLIGHNQLKSLPNSISGLKNLTELYIGPNQLTTLPAGIGGLKQLITLTIETNPLTDLPSAICELHNLQSIAIMGTQLRLLPDNIGALTQLKGVDLKDNELIALPNSIGTWQNLTSLVLERNRLEGLPSSIGRLTRLNTLRISGKDKVFEGATGGIRQLPDSIVYCSRLWDLMIERQPQLDAQDVLTKVARLKNLTHLKLTECNIDRIPDISWKEVNWNMLALNQNRLTELPAGLLDAPRLFIVAVSGNRLPEALNHDFHDKEGLRVAFVEAGMAPSNSLNKPNRRVAVAYQQMASQKARDRDWTGALNDLEKAIEFTPDTLLAFPYALRASMYFFRKAYTNALADFDKAILYAPNMRKELSHDTLAVTRMLATYWQQKATILGIIGQQDEAFKAILQAERFLPPTDLTPLSGRVHTESGRYLAQRNKVAEADSSFCRAIRAYEKLTYPDPGTRLTIVELSLLTGQYDRAQRTLNNLPSEQTRDGYEILKEYLTACLSVLKNEQTGPQAMERLTKYFSRHPAKVYGWSFDLFDSWLNRSKLASDKLTALRQLTDTTKERLVKPQ